MASPALHEQARTDRAAVRQRVQLRLQIARCLIADDYARADERDSRVESVLDALRFQAAQLKE